MIKFETIKKAKDGDEKATYEILEYYLRRIKKTCNNEEFVQNVLIKILVGIKRFVY